MAALPYRDAGGVEITATAIRLGGGAYSVAKLSSIVAEEVPPDTAHLVLKRVAAALAGFSALSLGALLLVEESHRPGIGGGFFVGGVLMVVLALKLERQIRAAKPTYRMRLTLSSGEVVTMKTSSRPQADGILAAANEAMTAFAASRGASEGGTTVSTTPGPADGQKDCPMCAEAVKSKARICRFCRYEFSEVGSSA